MSPMSETTRCGPPACWTWIRNSECTSPGDWAANGFGLPASVGIAMRTAVIKVINITGDGSVQINIQELDTLKRLDLDVCVIVLNNSALGMVKNFQDMYFDGNNQSTVIGYSKPGLRLGR